MILTRILISCTTRQKAKEKNWSKLSLNKTFLFQLQDALGSNLDFLAEFRKLLDAVFERHSDDEGDLILCIAVQFLCNATSGHSSVDSRVYVWDYFHCQFLWVHQNRSWHHVIITNYFSYSFFFIRRWVFQADLWSECQFSLCREIMYDLSNN